MPQVENIATLIDPPASEYTEPDWISRILHASGCDLLLDLHNVYANGVKHGYLPSTFLDEVPLERVGAIHLAGGKWIAAPDGRDRLLDDHQHDVPDPVYSLLEEVAARASQPLTVILERDANFGSIESLVQELELAREAVARGRARRASERPVGAGFEPAQAFERPVGAGFEPAQASERPVGAGCDPAHASERPVGAGCEPAHASAPSVGAGFKPARPATGVER